MTTTPLSPSIHAITSNVDLASTLGTGLGRLCFLIIAVLMACTLRELFRRDEKALADTSDPV